MTSDIKFARKLIGNLPHHLIDISGNYYTCRMDQNVTYWNEKILKCFLGVMPSDTGLQLEYHRYSALVINFYTPQKFQIVEILLRIIDQIDYFHFKILKNKQLKY